MSDDVKKDRRHGASDGGGDFGHTPFAALRPDGKPVPEPPVTRPPDEPDANAASSDGRAPKHGPRLVVRREKAGRGGKTVTRVSGLRERGRALESLVRELKQALGCGASVAGDDVLLQGAHTDGASAWLTRRLGAKVTIGN